MRQAIGGHLLAAQVGSVQVRSTSGRLLSLQASFAGTTELAQTHWIIRDWKPSSPHLALH